MPVQQRRKSKQYQGEPSGYDSDGGWEDDLPLQELQFGRTSPAANPFSNEPSDEDSEPDRTSHQLRALAALEGSSGADSASYKGKGKGKATERVLLPAGPSRNPTFASPEPQPRSQQQTEYEISQDQGPSFWPSHRGIPSRRVLSSLPVTQAPEVSRKDLYGGKTRSELYASYQGESPLGSVLEAEAEDHSLNLTTWPAANVLPVENSAPSRRRQPDVEAQATRATQASNTFLETLHVGVLKLIAPIGSYFDANPNFKRHLLAFSIFFYMAIFAILLLLAATGALTVKNYTPEGVVRYNEIYASQNAKAGEHG